MYTLRPDQQQMLKEIDEWYRKEYGSSTAWIVFSLIMTLIIIGLSIRLGQLNGLFSP